MHVASKSDRQLALEWWKSLTMEFRMRLAFRHKPDWSFHMVDKSSSTIERIWKSELLNPMI